MLMRITPLAIASSAKPSYAFFFSSRRRHTRYWRDWEFRRVLFRSQRDRLDLRQQLLQRLATAGIPEGQLVGDVVEEDPHAERFRDHGQLAADVAVPDDPERTATNLVDRKSVV